MEPTETQSPERVMTRRRGFSLVELLVSMSILLVIMVLIASMLGDIGSGWSQVRGRLVEFRDARNAFETITNRLSQARIDTYWDYEMSQGVPVRYRKSSHLHFVAGKADEFVPPSLVEGTGHAVFFEAPFGMSRDSSLDGLSSLLNGWGFFTGYGSNLEWQPEFARSRIPERHRFRMFEFHLPSENLLLHSEDGNGAAGYDWITSNLQSQNISILAENVIAFLIQPLHSLKQGEEHKLAEEYRFDSRAYELSPSDSNAERARHEVPPIIRVTMVVVAEADFARFQVSGNSIPEVFQIEDIAPFEKSRDYEVDLAALENHLQENRIDYRVFSTAISLRSAKWTNLNVGGGTP